MKNSEILSFYNKKRVLVTGHTGFKGSWLTKILLGAGAKVIGYSLPAPTEPSLYDLAGFDGYELAGRYVNVVGDVRDLDKLKETFEKYQPEIVLHLAAQPIVRDSYKNPVYTYETNVMGTVNVLECIRLCSSVRSAVMITTDKVYKNNEWIWGYREDEPLDGFDPYSNSKSCAELAVHSYINSFFAAMDGQKSDHSGDSRYVAVSTARAGNVIGGGDFANDRIIPDCVRAMERAYEEYHHGKNNALNADDKDGTSLRYEGVIGVRNPFSTRPYQHVLEPLAMYLTIAAKQWEDRSKASYYNVGPDDQDCVTTGNLVDLFCQKWNALQNARQFGSGYMTADVSDGSVCGGSSQGAKENDERTLPHARWENQAQANAPHEANFLKLDSTKIKTMLDYKPRWHIDECMEKTVLFSKVYMTRPGDIPAEMDKEIAEFFED